MFMPTQMKGTECEFVALRPGATLGEWLGLEPPAATGYSQPLLLTAQAALEISVVLNTWVLKELSLCPAADLGARRSEMLHFTPRYKSR